MSGGGALLGRMVGLVQAAKSSASTKLEIDLNYIAHDLIASPVTLTQRELPTSQ